MDSPSTSSDMSSAILLNDAGEPKSSCRVLQQEQVKCDWFNTAPIICHAGRVSTWKVWLAGSEPTYGDVYLTEHVDAFTSVDERHILRCRHDNGTYIPPINMTLPGRGRGRETLPSTITNCPRLSWTSPVPGGMSMTRTSRSPAWSRQSTSNSSYGGMGRYSAEHMGLGDGRRTC
jgi:hypothetical protein